MSLVVILNLEKNSPLEFDRIDKIDPVIIRISILLFNPWMRAEVHFLGCGHACIKFPGKVLPPMYSFDLLLIHFCF